MASFIGNYGESYTQNQMKSLMKDNIYGLYNSDYQSYKITYGKGLNFRVFSSGNGGKYHNGFYEIDVINLWERNIPLFFL